MSTSFPKDLVNARIQDHNNDVKLLHHLTMQRFPDLSQAFLSFIATGIELFDFEIGVISQVDGCLYRVLSTQAEQPLFQANQLYDLSPLFCHAVTQRNATLQYSDAENRDVFIRHGFYQSNGVCSYVGTPIIVDGKLFGILSFMTRDSKKPLLDWLLIELFEMMAQRLGHIIENEQYRRKQRLLQTQLQNAKLEFEETLNSVHEGIIRMDSDYQIQFANPEALYLLAKSFIDIEKTAIDNHVELFHDGKHTTFINLLYQAIHNDKRIVFSDDVAIKNHSGKCFEVEIVITPLSAAQGQSSGVVVSIEDISKQKRLARELRFQATHDSLTGLPNRCFFEQYAQQVWEDAQRYQQFFGMIFLDLNDFKQINDTLGHQAGDSLLKQVAERLKVSLRKSDIVARLGGDEFVVLARSMSCALEIQRVVEKVNALFEKPFLLADTQRTMVGSIGYAVYPQDGKTVKLLMHKADNNMYVDKRRKKSGLEC